MKIFKKESFLHYLVLAFFFTLAIVSFTILSFNQLFQALVAVFMAVIYIFWGILHHYIHDDLYPSVVIEYLLVASIGLVIVFSLILRT